MGFRGAVVQAWCGVILSADAAVANGAASAGPAVVALEDESPAVGTVVAESLPSPSELAAGPPDPGPAEPTDPHETRLMLGPSGRPLRKGSGYVSDHYVFVPGFGYGINDRVSVSGGVSVIPDLAFDRQLFYLSSSVGWRLDKNRAFSVGGLYARFIEGSEPGALLFGVGSFGPPENSLSVGLGWGAIRDHEATLDVHGRRTDVRTTWKLSRAPLVMAGITIRAARRVSVVGEAWPLQRTVGLGLRVFGERLSADVALVLLAGGLPAGYPIPWVSFTYHFGPSRKAASPRASGGLGLERWHRPDPSSR